MYQPSSGQYSYTKNTIINMEDNNFIPKQILVFMYGMYKNDMTINTVRKARLMYLFMIL